MSLGRIARACGIGRAEEIELSHGYIYSAHPLACAAALATLDVLQDGLLEQASSMMPIWEQVLHTLKGAPHVVDIRNFGLIGAIDVEPLPGAAGTYLGRHGHAVTAFDHFRLGNRKARRHDRRRSENHRLMAMLPDYPALQLIIGRDLIDAAARDSLPVFNPASGEVLADLPIATVDDLDDLDDLDDAVAAAPGGHIFMHGDQPERDDVYARIYAWLGTYLKP